jgi:hypothetical protein
LKKKWLRVYISNYNYFNFERPDLHSFIISAAAILPAPEVSPKTTKVSKNKQIQQDISEVFEKLEKKKEGRGNSYNCMFTSFLTRV